MTRSTKPLVQKSEPIPENPYQISLSTNMPAPKLKPSNIRFWLQMSPSVVKEQQYCIRHRVSHTMSEDEADPELLELLRQHVYGVHRTGVFPLERFSERGKTSAMNRYIGR